MAYNTPKFDENAHIKAMSDTQLWNTILQVENFISRTLIEEKHSEYLIKLRKERGDRIGRINRK